MTAELWIGLATTGGLIVGLSESGALPGPAPVAARRRAPPRRQAVRPLQRLLAEGLRGAGADQRRVGDARQRRQQRGDVPVEQPLAGGRLGPVPVDQPRPAVPSSTTLASPRSRWAIPAARRAATCRQIPSSWGSVSRSSPSSVRSRPVTRCWTSRPAPLSNDRTSSTGGHAGRRGSAIDARAPPGRPGRRAGWAAGPGGPASSRRGIAVAVRRSLEMTFTNRSGGSCW